MVVTTSGLGIYVIVTRLPQHDKKTTLVGTVVPRGPYQPSIVEELNNWNCKQIIEKILTRNVVYRPRPIAGADPYWANDYITSAESSSL